MPAKDFQPSRDQRQALHRWNRFVLGEKYTKEVEKKYPKSKAEKKSESNAFNLLDSIHSSEFSSLKPDIAPEHRLEVTLEPDKYTEEKFALFRDYQRHVHHESESEISSSGFKRFLCGSPLHRHTTPSGQKLGSYHHCYRLDGKLVAMSVIDLLPHAVSGVYFLYLSEYEKFSFGKLSALREAALAREGGYQYYYMGYYIHGCKKMRYKGDYKPQYVLDYHSREWDLLDDQIKSLMETQQYVSMSRERMKQVNGRTPNGGGDGQKSLESNKEDPLAYHADDDSIASDEEFKHPVAMDAMVSGLSLLQLGMPGVMSLPEMRARVALDDIQIFLGRGAVHRMQDIMAWGGGSETDSSTIKGVVAEFAAAVGPQIAKEIVVDFGR